MFNTKTMKKAGVLIGIVILLSLSVFAGTQIHPFSQITSGETDIGEEVINITGNSTYLFQINNSQSSGSPITVYGRTSSPLGYGIYGDGPISGYGIMAVSIGGVGASALADASQGKAVEAKSTATVGTNYGIWGETKSHNYGAGIYAHASSPTGTTYGIYSQVDSPNGYAGYFSSGKGLYLDPGPNLTTYTTGHDTSDYTLPIGYHHYCAISKQRIGADSTSNCWFTCQLSYNATNGNWSLRRQGSANCGVTCDAICFDFI